LSEAEYSYPIPGVNNMIDLFPTHHRPLFTVAKF